MTNFLIFRPSSKIGGAQQGLGYRPSRKKWWGKEIRDLDRINKYLGALQGVGDNRKITKKERKTQEERENKHRQIELQLANDLQKFRLYRYQNKNV